MKFFSMIFALDLIPFALLVFSFKGIDAVKIQDKFEESPRNGRAQFLSIRPFGKSIHLGLEFVVPFAKMPTKRKFDEKGNEKPLFTINSAAISIAGLLAGTGVLLGHLFRSLILFPDKISVPKARSLGELRSLDEVIMERIIDVTKQFKLVQHNSKEGRSEVNAANFLEVFEELLSRKDPNLKLKNCLEKSLCRSLVKLQQYIHHNEWDEILDIGNDFVNLKNITQNSIKYEDCENRYSMCEWKQPEIELQKFIKRNVEFI